MKNIILIASILIFSNLLNAQETRIGDYAPKVRRGTYLGITTGINNPGGLLGIRLNTNISDNTMLDFAAGSGTWGYKFSGAALLNTNKPKGIIPFVGFSYTTGKTNQIINSQVEDGTTPKSVDLNFNLNPAFNANLGAHYKWFSKNGNSYFIEFGYSIPVSGGDYDLLTKNYTLTDASKYAMNFLKPGGLIIGFTYLWAL